MKISRKIIYMFMIATLIASFSDQLVVYANSNFVSDVLIDQGLYRNTEPELVNYDLVFKSRESAMIWVREAFPDAWHFEFFVDNGGKYVKVYYDIEHRNEHFIVKYDLVRDGHCYIYN